MSYANALSNEINALLNELAESGQEWRAPMIAHEVCNRHTEGLAPSRDREFWRYCGYVHVRAEVTRCINRRAEDRPGETDPQYTLPGYQHLHAYYVVERDGEEVGVPVHDLTEIEIAAKVALYRRMGDACHAHADELVRYRETRAGAA